MLLNFYRHTFSFLSQNEDKPNLYVHFRKKAEAVLKLCKGHMWSYHAYLYITVL